ncbi:DNA polymerase IV [Natroniella sulfidigena]|uniref:DNA polymerase IV n=1 Tax=Natroniella sulfidigena TaxID=723921 RepID=UPI00200A7C54|nr:DNA polymerase IV [Natroniella sulfidigena]MCK8816261.1 DNA polymerase IV [Natroniella sulfidigena]
MELDIIHLDMDAFYAAVEMKDNPELVGKPVIIGGLSRRGVVSTASYQARNYGIHSAMPMHQARKLCPHGVYLKPRHGRYKEVSAKIQEIFCQYTELVEPLSLDEAFLDLSQNDRNSLQLAKEIKRRIKKEVGLVASVGVSYNKFLAKLASDFDKPDGFKVISPFAAEKILFPLDVSQLWGVGPQTEEKLKRLGLHKVKDIAQADKHFLIRKLGKKGYQLYNLAWGKDEREVTPAGPPKSIGKETTFRFDLDDKAAVLENLKRLSQQVAQRATKKGVKGRTVTVKIKYEDFTEISRSKTGERYLEAQEQIYQVAEQLLEDIELNKKIRLAGISLSTLNHSDFKQLKLFD